MKPLKGISVHRFDRLSKVAKLSFAVLALGQINAYAVPYTEEVSIVQQARKVTGTITDESGEPLPGITIKVKGRSTGTVSDYDGKYTINKLSKNDVLQFSFVGMKTQEIAVGNRTVIDVEMKSDAIMMQEVVAVGYGSLKRKDITGSISSVAGGEIAKRGDTNPMQALQGKIAGIQITNSTGRVGATPEIVIRGKSSFGNNSPLYVVDGTIVNNIDFLNPNDIASIDVLKDASSSAIYGSRGSNGVILIETKGASQNGVGTTDISVDAYYGIKSVARLPEFWKAKDYMKYQMASSINDNLLNNPKIEDFDDFFEVIFNNNFAKDGRTYQLAKKAWAGQYDGFDWADFMLKNGSQSNIHMNISHNKAGSHYNMGVGYQEESGLVPNEKVQKYTINGSINQKINDKFRAIINFNAAFTNNERGHDKAIRDVFNFNPLIEPWVIDENNQPIIGELAYQPAAQKGHTYGTGCVNPMLNLMNTQDNSRQWRFFGNLALEYKPVKWLTLKSTFSPYVKLQRNGRFWGADTEDNMDSRLPKSSKEYSEDFSWTWDNQINFHYTFNKKHDLNLLLLQSAYLSRTEGGELSSRRQPWETGFHNIGSGESDTYDLGSWFEQDQMLSYAARFNYGFNDKYLFTFTARTDGTSKFAPGHRWGWFPSGAIGWRMSEEPFIKNLNFVDNLKLRFSVGQSGNNSVGPYSTLNRLNRMQRYDFNSQILDGWYSSDLANKGLKWEKVTEYNLGLDFSVLNSRISGTFDWYNRRSDQLLVDQRLAFETGFEEMRSNAAEVQNRGVELTLNTVNVKTSNVNWSTTFTFAKNKNEVLSVYGQKIDDVGNRRFIGQSLDVIYAYQFDGIWQEDQAAEAAKYDQKPGEARVKDINNDGKITADEDRVFIGHSDPSWEGGITSNLQVYGFDLSISLYTRQGVTAFSGFHERYGELQNRAGNKVSSTDYWIPTNRFIEANPSNTAPRPRFEGRFWYGDDGVANYRKMDYVKINNISLGYTVPKKFLSKLNVKDLRLYINVLNPFVFTDYDGYDPEWGSADKSDARIATVTTQFGFNLKF